MPGLPGLILPSAADREIFAALVSKDREERGVTPLQIARPTSRRYGPAVCTPARAQRMIKPQWGTHMSKEILIEIASRIAAGIVAGRPLSEVVAQKSAQIASVAQDAVRLAREIEKEAAKSA